MTFARPELLALAPLLVLVAFLGVAAQWRRGLRLADAYGGARAGTRLAARDLTRFPTLRVAALAVAAVALSAAAAGPEPLERVAPRSERAVDVVLAIDLSMSMSAEDVRGSRARRAHEIATRIVDALGSERIGVAVFADWPYTLVPLTDDPNVVRFFAASLDPRLVGDRDQGSDLGAVLTHARRTLDARRREEAEGVVVLLTDGEVHDDEQRALDSARVASAEGVRIWTAGIGTEAGAALPPREENAGPPVDETGAPVVTRMNARLLRAIAETGGGAFHDVSDDRGMGALLEELTAAVGTSGPGAERTNLAWWLTLLALLALGTEGVADARRGRRAGNRHRGEVLP